MTTKTKKLVIVESPTKAKTLGKFLGSNYSVAASVGHIRDLPKSSLGVDVDHDFTPVYEIPDTKEKVVSKLISKVKKASEVYLATDLDREGEAIAWHLAHVLNLNLAKTPRVVFHEITKSAIKAAFEKPRCLNQKLVDAQQARRVLDRLVGYKLSPLLWKKIRYGLSAGRVQSIALRFIVEREKERDNFKSSPYWTVSTLLSKNGSTFSATIISKDSKLFSSAQTLHLFAGNYTVSNSSLTSKKDVNAVLTDLRNEKFIVSKVTKKEVAKSAPAPFITSSLQRTSATSFGLSSRKTMRLAQQLYEKGLITYHRTDSVFLSKSFTEKARAYAKKKYGSQYVPASANAFKTKAKSAQEAHEAIRPTKVVETPSEKLTPDQQKLYSLIFKRTVASQLTPAIHFRVSVDISAGSYQLRASGSSVKFDGWMCIYDRGDVGSFLPDLQKGDVLELVDITGQEHATKAPPRYTEASLIKVLEEYAIGRPSTYSSIMSTVQSRLYVYKDGQAFVPTDTGFVVSNLLAEHFPNIVDIGFTASMEAKLDDVAEGKLKWVPLVRDFYTPFEKTLQKKDAELRKDQITTLGATDKKCPDCGKPLVIKLGKYGKFLSCTGFPECKYGEPLVEGSGGEGTGVEVDESQLGKCPECKSELKYKQGRFGAFIGCSGYPKCKFTKPYLEKIGMKCPECGEGEVVVKRTKRKRIFFGCSRYPECKYTSWKKPE